MRFAGGLVVVVVAVACAAAVAGAQTGSTAAASPNLTAQEVQAGPSNRRVRFIAQISDGCPRRVTRTVLQQRGDEVVVGFAQRREPQDDSHAYVCTQALRTICVEVLLSRRLGDRRVYTLRGTRRVRTPRVAPDGRKTCARVPPGSEGLTL